MCRYQSRGDPLVLEEIKSIPQCIHCGGSCVFELQLLPQIIYLLQEGLKTATAASDPILKGITLPVVEYGTVLVYTCKESCWNDECNQFCKENLIVQQVDERWKLGH